MFCPFVGKREQIRLAAVFEYHGVTPQLMTNDVVFETEDGESKSVSVRTYCQSLLAGDTLESQSAAQRAALQTLAADVLNYGAAAQLQQNYRTEDLANNVLTDEQKDVNAVKDFFCRCDFNEIITYSFVSEKDFDLFSLDKSDAVRIVNPLGEDVSVMRVSLVPSMVNAVAKNLNRQNGEGRLFELANVYFAAGAEEIAAQKRRLAFGVFGEEEDFFSVKGVVEELLREFCAGKKAVYKRSEKTWLHPTVSADVFIDGKPVGSFGALHPEVAEKYGIDKRVFAGEFDYETLKDAFNGKIEFKAISKYPAVERDIAVTVDEKALCGDLKEEIEASAGEHLESVKLFDVYRGDQIATGKKSMAFNLVFSSLERTLTVEEVDGAVANVLSSLKQKFGAELR